MSIAALDFGSRRIGVAVTDADAIGAYPLGIVQRRAAARDIEGIAAMLGERRIDIFVVGLPLNMDGSEGPAAVSARKFAALLAAELRVTVELFDERLTTLEARERLTGMPAKRGTRKRGIDALAAVVILEGWMQANPGKIVRARG